MPSGYQSGDGCLMWLPPEGYKPTLLTISDDKGNFIITDDHGLKFEINGDRRSLAFHLLEHGLEYGLSHCRMYAKTIHVATLATDFELSIGPFDFTFANQKLVEINARYREGQRPPYYDEIKFPEERSEVLEIIDIMKSIWKMKVFL